MTTCLGKSCSFGLPRVPFVNCCQFMYLVFFSFWFSGQDMGSFVSLPDHYLSFYFAGTTFSRCNGVLKGTTAVLDAVPPPPRSV